MNVQEDSVTRAKSFFQHPKLEEYLECGIKSKGIAENALLVYLHLIEVQNWFDVDSVVIPSDQIILLKGKRNEKADTEFVLPLTSDFMCDTVSLNKYIDVAVECGCTNNGLLMGFVDDTSSIVFYKINKGLIPPNKPSNRELQKMTQLPEWNEQKGKWKF